MLRFVKFFCIVLFSFLIFGCDGGGRLGADRWAQFHADGPSQGFTGVNSSYALQPMWTIEIGQVSHSSPTIGEDGTIYIGTVDGRLVAVFPNGTMNCTAQLSNDSIISSPAIAEGGNIYVITIRKTNENIFSSTLYSVRPDCEVNWQYTFPGISSEILGHTTASAKTWSSERNTYIFVPVRLSRPRDSPDNDDKEDGLNELFVFDQSGNVVSRRAIGGCVRVSGGGSDIGEILSDIWDFITSIECCDTTATIGPSPPLYQIFGWLDPTVAIVDFSNLEIENQSLSERPLVVVANVCLGLRLTGFQWDPIDLTLNRIWTYDDDSDKYDYSSPAVFLNGLLVLGRKDGLVQAFDPLTGNKLWDYDTEEELLATPASFGRQIYISSLRHLHVLESSGQPVVDPNSPLAEALTKLEGQTIASPALTADFVYVSTSYGIHTRSFDLFTRASDGNAPGGLSSPAVGEDGTVYVVTAEQGTSFLRAYPGR